MSGCTDLCDSHRGSLHCQWVPPAKAWAGRLGKEMQNTGAVDLELTNADSSLSLIRILSCENRINFCLIPKVPPLETDTDIISFKELSKHTCFFPPSLQLQPDKEEEEDIFRKWYFLLCIRLMDRIQAEETEAQTSGWEGQNTIYHLWWHHFKYQRPSN